MPQSDKVSQFLSTSHCGLCSAALRYPDTKGTELSFTMYILAPLGKREVAFLLLLLASSMGGIGGAPLEVSLDFNWKFNWCFDNMHVK